MDKLKNEWVLRVLRVEMPDASPVPVISPVLLGKSVLAWRGIAAKARADIAVLCKNVLAAARQDDDIGPEDFSIIEARLVRVERVSEQIDEDLADEIDALINTAPEKRGPAITKVLGRVETCRKFLTADEVASMLADNEFHATPVQSMALTALGSIRTALGAVAA